MSQNNQPICETDERGVKRWYLNGRLHREDGPAIEGIDGHKSWFFHGQLHRLDGPAIEYATGSKAWLINGQRHRIDGPAIEYYDGDKRWWYQGKLINVYSQKEFEKLLKLKVLW